MVKSYSQSLHRGYGYVPDRKVVEIKHKFDVEPYLPGGGYGITIRDFDLSGGRIIEGTASTPTVCTSGNGYTISLASRGCKAKLPVPLMSQHGHVRGKEKSASIAVGRIGWVFRVEIHDRSVRVRAVLDKSEAADYAWRLIEDGTTMCFSVLAADQHPNGVVDGVTFIDEWSMKEVSICRRGANPDARFYIAK